MYTREAITSTDPREIGKVTFPVSFLLEDQIYETFQLKRFNIFNVRKDFDDLDTMSPFHFSSRKDIQRANVLIEWKITFLVSPGLVPDNGYPESFTTTIVTPASFLKDDVEVAFAREFQAVIEHIVYVYMPGSLKRVRGKSVSS